MHLNIFPYQTGNTSGTVQSPVNLTQSHIYEEVGQKPKCEDIELSTNAAYEMIKKWWNTQELQQIHHLQLSDFDWRIHAAYSSLNRNVS